MICHPFRNSNLFDVSKFIYEKCNMYLLLLLALHRFIHYSKHKNRLIAICLAKWKKNPEIYTSKVNSAMCRISLSSTYDCTVLITYIRFIFFIEIHFVGVV